MRVIVAGSRKLGHIPKKPKPSEDDLQVYLWLKEFCENRIIELKNRWKDEHGPITVVISGCANGIDTLAIDLAKRITGKSAMKFPADWFKDGKRAGMIRNETMGAQADGAIIIALPDSKGSYHMAKVCRDKGIPYYLDVLDYDELEMYVPGVKELLLR